MALQALAQTLFNFVLPATCGACKQVVSQPGALCPDCWRALNFIAAPYCVCCGLPFDVPMEEGSLCAACLTEPPAFEKARAALSYNDVARRLIGRFKYGDQTHLAPTFAPWLQRAAADLLPGCDLIVPVPLYRWRLWKRRFNQSALLARDLALASGIPLSLTALQRIRATSPQVGKTRAERLKNVTKAFVAPTEVADKTVILVDDVLTTGATLEACCRALLDAGAKAVRVLTLARVVKPTHLD